MGNHSASRVIAVLGPTNTGKTHLAVDRLCAHSSGIIGFPLRLLAREVYDRVVAIKGPSEVGLITGEEKIMPPGARWILATVESMPVDRDVAFLAIDEAQLGADPERGHVFTDRLLNARGREETMILGSDTLRPLIRALLPDAEIITRPRFSSLDYAGTKKLTRLPPRSAIVGFSTEDVYAAAELLRRTKGGAAVVMGALSPATRNAQVAMFQSGEVDYIVATDAIGMGLNMDVGHVAFASLTKFDGRRQRRLFVTEMAQIAGRAGRHHRNGSFGTLSAFGPSAELTPEEIDRIENHRFRPLDYLMWRGPDLDLSSPAALALSLEQPSDNPLLRLGSQATDLAVLQAVSDLPAIRSRRWTPSETERLWRACRIPDFLKRGADIHAGFIARLWSHIGQGSGRIADSWIGAELARLDVVQGDIDTLSMRLAAVRSWAYIAHQPDWLADPAHWAERAISIERRLSDVLHARLTERFVDRRSRLLRQSRAMPAHLLPVDITTGGDVLVEGEMIGQLEGFTFRTAADASHSERKALLAAADRRLRAELDRRAEALAQASDSEISLDALTGGTAALLWKGAKVATLARGSALLTPRIMATPGLAHLPTGVRTLALARLERWMRARIDQRLGPLRWLARAAQSSAHPPGIRAVLAALHAGLGHIKRHDLATTLSTLSKAERAWLRQAGITLGPLDLFMPALLKPQAAALRIILTCIHDGQPILPCPMPGLGLIDRPAPDLAAGARLAGYRAFGDQMIRLDLVDRMATALHRQRGDARAFVPDPALAGRIGIGQETFARLLRALGFHPSIKHGPDHWHWRGPVSPKPDMRPDNPAFAVLKGLRK